MKKIAAICLLALFTVNPLFADAADSADSGNTFKSTGDPTLDFFVALSQCIPGEYNEKNIITKTSGEEWLKHNVVRLDQEVCYVELATPDNRVLFCEFPIEELSVVNEQHFLHGVLINSLSDPSEDSIKAEIVWADLKSENCTFFPE